MSWATGIIQFPAEALMGLFVYATALRAALGVHLASCPVVTGGSYPGGKATGGVKLATHFHLVPRLKMRGSVPPLPHTSS